LPALLFMAFHVMAWRAIFLFTVSSKLLRTIMLIAYFIAYSVDISGIFSGYIALYLGLKPL